MMSWPRAYASRLRRRNHEKEEQVKSLMLFRNKLAHHISDSYADFVVSTIKRPVRPDQFDVTSRIVVKYLPEFARAGLTKILNEANRLHCDLSTVVVGIAWSLGGKHLLQVLKDYNLRMALPHNMVPFQVVHC